MSKIKKLVLGLSVALTMAIAFVVGLIGVNQTSNQTVGGGTSSTKPSNNLEFEIEETKPTTITHAPNEIKVVEGGDTINYSYSPDVNAKDNAKTIAYEYVFGATADTMAVDIAGIEAEDVDISYIYSDSRIDTTGTLTSYTNYNIQKITTTGKWKYIYIVVSAQNELPTNFSKDIKWCYGKAGEVTVANNFNSETSTITIVKGAEMRQPADLAPLSNGYEFRGWYLDSNCTTPATFPLYTTGQTLYAKFPNLPTSYLAWDSATSSYYVKKGSGTLPQNLIIPANYNDGSHGLASVTYIYGTSYNDGAFNYKTTLKSVDLPSNITSIGSYAFYACSGLTSIDLSRCTSLTSIGERAFNSCSGLTCIVIPLSVTSIGQSAFSNCYALAEVYDLSSSLTITAGSSDNGYVGNYAKVIHTSLDTPTTIRTIGDMYYCEYGTEFIAVGPTDRNTTSVTLDSRTTAIKNSAFQGCSGLTSTTLPSSLTSIGNSAFQGCSGLTSITLPSSLTSIGNSAFQGCSGLTKDLVIPSGVTGIGSYAFYGCGGLTSIILSSSLASIGDMAFHNCHSLAEVYNLSTNLNITPGSLGNGYVGYYAVAIYTDINIESRIQTINNMYYYVYETDFIAVGPTDRNTTSVTLDSRTTAIKNNAFHYCTKLTSMDLSGCTNMTNIGWHAFYRCFSLISIILPNSLTSIDEWVFRECSKLTSIDLSGCTSLTSIGNQAFYSCSKLTSIVISASVTKIGSYAFQSCTNLTSVTFEDTSTWYYTSDSNYIGGTEIDLADASANATYFKTTYYSKYWYKV